MDHAEQARTLADDVSKRGRGHTSEDADMIADALVAATQALLAIGETIRQQAAQDRPSRRWRRRADR
jgi:hypothetical protein